jgi:hypothetical protein
MTDANIAKMFSCRRVGLTSRLLDMVRKRVSKVVIARFYEAEAELPHQGVHFSSARLTL